MSGSERLRQHDIPRDARSMMSFASEFQDAIDLEVAAAHADARWEYPQDTAIDLKDSKFWAYWISKSAQPIERAKKGTQIEEHFRAQSRSRYRLNDRQPDFTISLVGDLMRTPGLESSAASLYADVEDLIFGADVSFGNLESTLGTGEPVPLSFTQDDAPAINLNLAEYQCLVRSGGRHFDVLTLANNHILDCGLGGIERTCAQLENDGIAQVGVNPVKPAQEGEPQILEHAGLRIGWVAHTFSVNFKDFPPGHEQIVNMTPFHLQPDPDLGPLKRQIRSARDQGCDMVIVSLHWGLEFELYPHPHQLVWAREMADAGADLIVGHHPHVAQPVEVYSPPDDPERQVPILYSLGNLTPVFSHPATAMSLVVRLGISTGRTEEGLRAKVCRMEIFPVALLADAGGDEPQLHLKRLSDLNSTASAQALSGYVAEMARYADLVIGSGWKEREA